MVYLSKFKLLNEDEEYNLIAYKEKRRIFNNQYPLKIFTSKSFENITFDAITIFYGGNGSGKSTLLNIISDKINANKKSDIDKGSFFNEYVKMCDYEMNMAPNEIKNITSDDVFDYLLDIRFINNNVNRRKEELSKEYLETKFNDGETVFSNYEKLKNKTDSYHKTMSKYVRERLTNNNLNEQSNGESALMFWEREIKENGIYILDEPENSLSAENQLKLKKFIEESARFYNCQFIISTHSPFLLSLEEATIYDLDSIPVTIKNWTNLKNMKVYYDFFKENKDKFN